MRLTLVIAAALFLACASQTEKDLEAARARWASQKLTDYRMTEQLGCFCPPDVNAPASVTVTAGSITAVASVDTGKPIEQKLWSSWKTVDELFAVIDDAIARNAAKIDVTYDATRGFPTRLFIDYELNVADEEQSFQVTSVEPLAP